MQATRPFSNEWHTSPRLISPVAAHPRSSTHPLAPSYAALGLPAGAPGAHSGPRRAHSPRGPAAHLPKPRPTNLYYCACIFMSELVSVVGTYTCICVGWKEPIGRIFSCENSSSSILSFYELPRINETLLLQSVRIQLAWCVAKF